MSLISQIKDTQPSVEIPKQNNHVSKRVFAEKQTELFSSVSKTELPLLELLVDHINESNKLICII